MAETESQIEGGETETSEFAEGITTESTTGEYKSTEDFMSGDDVRREQDKIGRTRRRKKKRFRMERCINERHIREGESLWRIYMKS